MRDIHLIHLINDELLRIFLLCRFFPLTERPHIPQTKSPPGDVARAHHDGDERRQSGDVRRRLHETAVHARVAPAGVPDHHVQIAPLHAVGVHAPRLTVAQPARVQQRELLLSRAVRVRPTPGGRRRN